MTLQTQFRRSLFSIAILIAFGGLAAMEGQAFADPQADSAAIASCPSLDDVDEPVASTGGGSPARGDWRALLPAMIAR